MERVLEFVDNEGSLYMVRKVGNVYPSKRIREHFGLVIGRFSLVLEKCTCGEYKLELSTGNPREYFCLLRNNSPVGILCKHIIQDEFDLDLGDRFNVKITKI